MIQPAKIQVRFSDLDILGHVNNSVYLSYFEYARVHYFAQLLGTDWDWNEQGVLLVRNEIDYLAPVYLHSIPMITIEVLKIGTKSFTLGYIVEVDKQITTKGKSILVCYDASKGQTIEIPDSFKVALGKLSKAQ